MDSWCWLQIVTLPSAASAEIQTPQTRLRVLVFNCPVLVSLCHCSLTVLLLADRRGAWCGLCCCRTIQGQHAVYSEGLLWVTVISLSAPDELCSLGNHNNQTPKPLQIAASFIYSQYKSCKIKDGPDWLRRSLTGELLSSTELSDTIDAVLQRNKPFSVLIIQVILSRCSPMTQCLLFCCFLFCWPTLEASMQPLCTQWVCILHIHPETTFMSYYVTEMSKLW